LATGDWGDDSVCLWEVASGQPVHQFAANLEVSQDNILVFSPDGRSLAAGGKGGVVVLIWDVTGRLRQGRLPRVELPPEDLARQWRALAGEPARSERAIWKLVAAGKQTTAFCREQLKPAVAADPQRLAGLLEALNHRRFARRQRATRELEELGDLAYPALRRILADHLPLEIRQRVERLLARLPAEWLRIGRTIAVLERLNSPEARALLAKLAKGAPEARQTQEAIAALKRLTGPPPGKP
jgi:hypothetical protein